MALQDFINKYKNSGLDIDYKGADLTMNSFPEDIAGITIKQGTASKEILEEAYCDLDIIETYEN